MWNLNFDSYQDVKNILHKYTYVVSIIFSLLVYFLILPDNHKVALNTFFGNITNLIPVGIVISILFGFIVSFLFIHMFEIYDKVYDKYVIRWRYKYARDFILPELFKPLINKLDSRFLSTASKNMRQFMNIFYYFVGDRDMKIRKNAVVRFYEAVWKYWVTQINEVILIIFGVIILGYGIYYKINNLQISSLVIPLIILFVIFIINRLIIKYFLNDVYIATKEEIEEIHTNFQSLLEDKAKDISQEFNLTYGNN